MLSYLRDKPAVQRCYASRRVCACLLSVTRCDDRAFRRRQDSTRWTPATGWRPSRAGARTRRLRGSTSASCCSCTLRWRSSSIVRRRPRRHDRADPTRSRSTATETSRAPIISSISLLPSALHIHTYIQTYIHTNLYSAKIVKRF